MFGAALRHWVLYTRKCALEIKRSYFNGTTEERPTSLNCIHCRRVLYCCFEVWWFYLYQSCSHPYKKAYSRVQISRSVLLLYFYFLHFFFITEYCNKNQNTHNGISQSSFIKHFCVAKGWCCSHHFNVNLKSTERTVTMVAQRVTIKAVCQWFSNCVAGTAFDAQGTFAGLGFTPFLSADHCHVLIYNFYCAGHLKLVKLIRCL